jgi:monoamine oxidase
LNLARAHGLTLVPFESSTGAPVVTIQGVSASAEQPLDHTPLPIQLRADEKRFTARALLEHYVGEVPARMDDPAASGSSYLAWQPYDLQTWPQWLRSRGASPAAVALLTAGGDSHELSALYVLRQFALLRQAVHFFKITGGMDLLPKAMAAALGDAVRYDAQVRRVVREAGRISLEYLQSGTERRISARDVILTMPFSTLRDVDIRPRLSPRKRQAIAELPYYAPMRVLLQTHRRFWTAAGLNGSARTDQPAEIWDCTYDLSSQRGLLGATLGGTAADLSARMTAAQSIDLGRNAVARTFPGMTSNFEKGIAWRWRLEPWSRGAFAVCHPGQMTALMPDIAAGDGRIHFAGEHTSPWMGWMEGALESGERAAREVLNGSSRPSD